MTQTHTDEIESALDACDEVRTITPNDSYGDDGGNWLVEAWLEYGTETTEPLEDVLEKFDLRIWNADFEYSKVTLAPREGFSYGHGDPLRQRQNIDSAFSRKSEVRRTETLLYPEAPRLRVIVEMEYGEPTLAAVATLLARQDLAIYSVDFQRGKATVVPTDQLVYGGGGE